jgi:hypothetical protein
MPSRTKLLDKLNRAEFKKLPCIRCLASGLDIIASLWEEKDMKQGPDRKDLICSKCYETESEPGHKKIPRELINYYGLFIKEFEAYRDSHRLNR